MRTTQTGRDVRIEDYVIIYFNKNIKHVRLYLSHDKARGRLEAITRQNLNT